MVYNGTSSSAFLNGSWKSTKTITAATDNGKTLVLGNNQALNEATFKGSLDEMRLRDAVSSADWIKAEYDTVANAAFATCGTIEPIIAELPALGASSVGDVDFHAAELTYTIARLGTSNPDILIAYGTSADNLAQTNLVASGVSATGTSSHTLAGLLCSTTYYAHHIATNASGSASSGVFSFTTPGEPALGSPTLSATGTTLDITGSLTDIGVSNATVELWFGTSSNTLSVIETWGDLAAPQSFSKTLTSQPFGTYFAAFRAYNVCNGATNETWTAIVNDTIFGTCTWTGSGGDLSWNNPDNWSSGTVPGFKDTAVFTDNGTGGSPTLKLNAGQHVFKLVIQTVNPFTIGNAFDKTNASPNKLTLTDLERKDVTGTEGLHAFGTAVVLFPDETGNANWIVNGSSELRLTASLDGAVSGVGLVKTGTGTLALNDNTTYTGTTTVLEGAVNRPTFGSFGNNLGGNVVVGSPEGTVPASYSASNGGRPKNATVYPNGTYTQGDWPGLGYLTIIGGTANCSWANIDGDIKMTGGTLNSGPIERGGTGFIGGVANYSNANVVVSSASSENPAVIAPGTLDPAAGKHVFGTITAGSAVQANNVTFGNNGLLRVQIGPDGEADKLDVYGTVDLSSASDGMTLTVDPDAKTGTYVLVSATDGITGTFDAVAAPKPAWVHYTATTVEYTVPPVEALIIMR